MPLSNVAYFLCLPQLVWFSNSGTVPPSFTAVPAAPSATVCTGEVDPGAIAVLSAANPICNEDGLGVLMLCCFSGVCGVAACVGDLDSDGTVHISVPWLHSGSHPQAHD